MLFRIDFEIGIYPDRIQISDRRSGRFVDFAAEIPFSAPGKLVHNAVYFENALAKAIRKVMHGGFILYDAQADVAGGQSLKEHDRTAIRRALRDIGFKTISFDGLNPGESVPPLPAGLAALF